MQRLGEILKSCPIVPDELQPSTSSSWPLRQSAAQEQWKEARPYHLKCLLETEAVGQELCCRCSQAAVLRPSHPPRSLRKWKQTSTTLEQACLLPTKRPPQPCSCDTTNITVSAGRAVIMISMKGNT
ncbi:hypothetical protein SKAU_G00235290 [Synaphobranchus kaupii]|uniref:Uncharacterized protein n=1 Tax=Synaphobranchus kaupii TaxID=118154 RepID=A0A9Q1F6I5_SYNKA|nr:hypothetical protein SKAU_G00235290 [Synaphobranchus kaupii]